MAVWTPITAALIAIGKGIKATTHLAIFDNITALAEGASGAPSIEEAALGSGIVSRSKLKTAAVTSIAGSINSGSVANLTLTHYCFFPMIHGQDNKLRVIGHSTDGASADAPRLGFWNADASLTKTYDVDYRYVAA